ncbi:MAG: hypothetical protein K2N81_01910 [Acetatifactor sp.]|nr:hypothetical protein [Acetatifactor sp.]
MKNPNSFSLRTLEERHITLTGITVMNLRRQVSRKISKKKSKGYKKRTDRKYLLGRTYKGYETYTADNPEVFVTQMNTIYNDETNRPFLQTFKFVRAGVLLPSIMKKRLHLPWKRVWNFSKPYVGNNSSQNMSMSFSLTGYPNSLQRKPWRLARMAQEALKYCNT